MKLNKIAVGVALAAGTMAAQAADVLLFPYVVSGGSVTTLVSVINTDDGVTDPAAYYNGNGSAIGGFGAANRFLHWRYHIKTADTLAASCLENDGYFPTSPLDLVTYDVSGTRGQGGVMFNDPSSNNNWQAAGPLNQLSAITLNGQRGVLFVHNAGTTGLTAAPELAGEALVVEFDTGAAWGYAAVPSSVAGVSTAADFDFSPAGPGGAAIGPIADRVTIMPMNEVTTRFFVTPVNDPAAATPTASMLAANGLDVAGFGGLRTRVDLLPLTGSIRVVSRDEGGISGGVTPQDVTCVGPVDASTLITAANILNYANPQGGWANMVSAAPVVGAADLAANIRPTANAAAIKLEFRPAGAGGQFNMDAGVGAFNSAFRIN